MAKKKQTSPGHAGPQTATVPRKGSTGSHTHRSGILPNAPPGLQLEPALQSLEEELKKWHDHMSDDDRQQIRKAIEELMDKYL
jgi:hypothetical protein